MTLPIGVEGPVTAEVFVVARDGDHLVLTGPCGADPWLMETRAEHPLETVRRIVTGVLPDALVVHSTSWRFERGAVHLTFVAVIGAESIGDMERTSIEHVGLARGTAHAAPESIAWNQVLEHGLRHLAWLAREDDAVRSTLDSGWHDVLGEYVPEPFRQLDDPKGTP